MTRVKVIGAGQLGSRHLQALQAVSQPLEIHVIDPSPSSLEVARERFFATASETSHDIRFSTTFEPTGDTDIAIVATNSDVRRSVVEQMLKASSVRYLILEKLLFSRREDYVGFEDMLRARGTHAWVNCPMRMMQPYEVIRAELDHGPITYRVSGSNFGMVTNSIHYLDHVAHLTGCSSFSLNSTGIAARPVDSKRAGFKELHGRLVADFADGSRCEISCAPDGDTPVLVEIFGGSGRYIVRENEGRMWRSIAADKWVWGEHEARIPYQSQLTTMVVQRMLDKGECPLTPLKESIDLHLQLMEGLMPIVQAAEINVAEFPFT